jgi:hypothetical protein
MNGIPPTKFPHFIHIYKKIIITKRRVAKMKSGNLLFLSHSNYQLLGM